MVLKEIFVIVAFICILSGIISGAVAVQKTAARQMNIAEKIIESANEVD